MMYIDAAAEAERLKPKAHEFARSLNERYGALMGSRRLTGTADAYSVKSGWEPVILLGFAPNLALMDPSVIDIEGAQRADLVMTLLAAFDAHETEVRTARPH